MTFQWRASSEKDFDFLTFDDGQNSVSQLSGDTGWQYREAYFPNGRSFPNGATPSSKNLITIINHPPLIVANPCIISRFSLWAQSGWGSTVCPGCTAVPQQPKYPRWTYSKDPAVTSFNDAGYLDDLQFRSLTEVNFQHFQYFQVAAFLGFPCIPSPFFSNVFACFSLRFKSCFLAFLSSDHLHVAGQPALADCQLGLGLHQLWKRELLCQNCYYC